MKLQFRLVTPSSLKTLRGLNTLRMLKLAQSHGLLPGLVLIVEIEYKSGGKEKIQILAEEIEVSETPLKLSVPSMKKTISQEKYDRIFKEFNKKDREMSGQGVDTSD